MLDLNSLSVFLAIAEYGSFSEAGRRLNLTQSAVSQTIQGLERDLGQNFSTGKGRVYV